MPVAPVTNIRYGHSLVARMISVIVTLNSACRKTERYDGQESWMVAGPPTLENRGPATYEGGRRWDDSVDVVRWPEDEDCHHTWQLDIGSAWKMSGTTTIFPSNGTSGGALHSGPEMINFGMVEQILFVFVYLFITSDTVWPLIILWNQKIPFFAPTLWSVLVKEFEKLKSF